MSMRHRFSFVLVAMFGLVGVASALAHHSVSGVFDTHKQIVLKGVISKVEWLNPHTFIHLDVKDNDGKINRANPDAPGTDIGLQLWDEPQRRQPPHSTRPDNN